MNFTLNFRERRMVPSAELRRVAHVDFPGGFYALVLEERGTYKVALYDPSGERIEQERWHGCNLDTVAMILGAMHRYAEKKQTGERHAQH